MTTPSTVPPKRRKTAAKLALVAMLFSVLAPFAQVIAAAALPAQVVDPFRVICTAQGLDILPAPGEADRETPEAPDTCAFCLVASSPADAVAASPLTVPAIHDLALAPAGERSPRASRAATVHARAPPPSFRT